MLTSVVCDVRARSNGQSRRGGIRLASVAADVGDSHVRDGGLRVVVIRFANIHPVPSTIDRGEGVCITVSNAEI